MSDPIRDRIERTLLSHRLQHQVIDGSDYDHLPLLDALSTGDDVSTGRNELELLADEIAGDLEEVMPTPPPEPDLEAGGAPGKVTSDGPKGKVHRCMRCGEEFTCPVPEHCEAGYDVLPRHWMLEGGKPTLVDHCPPPGRPPGHQDDHEVGTYAVSAPVEEPRGGAAGEGVTRIAAERNRQVGEEGYTPTHDSAHDDGALAAAAACYAEYAAGQQVADTRPPGLPPLGTPGNWPFELQAWKPSLDPVRNLERAGALIAAEIDRLLRDPTP